PVDIETLRRAAVSEGGLLTDEIRREVWPKLLSVNVYKLPAKPTKDIRENHKDFNQVLLDVRRSLKRFPRGNSLTKLVLQEQLIDSILIVLQKNPALHYYQGYHDIVVTFLLVVGERMAIAMVCDFMDPTMDTGSSHGHVLSEIRHVLRLYDFFLASHPLMAVYFAAVWEVMNTFPTRAMLFSLYSCLPPEQKQYLLLSLSSITINCFKAFQMTTQQQRPDSVLRRQLHWGPAQGRGGPDSQMALPRDTQPNQAANQLIKMAVWGISATLGAALY
uniref:Zgc:63863 n=1 Tax=Oncorhynchus mykiss TaxID=8022 RepID=A0A8K9WS47_ONCMY